MAQLTGQERATYVQDMFARIAERYDRMNRLMTFGQDLKWRRVVIEKAAIPPHGKLLDIATGTGDIAHEALKQRQDIQAVGGDFVVEMMQAGKRYPERAPIRWVGSDALALPFPTAYFDAVTSGFLMRNIIDVRRGFQEQLRVLKPGGRVVVLDSSPPKDNLLKPFIMIHLNHVIPTLGKLMTGEADAYRYLPDSTQKFLAPQDLATEMEQAGFVDVNYKTFMFGTVAIHWGSKPAV